MSYYDNQAWPNSARQPSWEQPAPPSRSGASSAVQREEPNAFQAQFEEVDRAMDNLVKSGKLFNVPGRRDSMPPVGPGRTFGEYDPRLGGAAPPQRHHSVSDFEPMRTHSAGNVQGFYASQRYGGRPSEVDQMMQGKRRLAAQRERELRNYHQEQQYNRSLLAEIATQGKTDRALSPGMMSEEERRELIARQHRALYGNDAPAYYGSGGFGSETHTPRPGTQAASVPASAATSARGQSPLAFDPFGMAQSQASLASAESSTNEQQAAPHAAPSGQSQPGHQGQRSRANSTSSPASNPNSFSLFENAQQSSRTSTSSPGGSPPRQNAKSGPTSGGVAPIGTRPAGNVQGQAANPALNKRSTTPLPSPLSYGFARNEDKQSTEKTTSAGSTPAVSAPESNVGLGWGSKSGVWGTKSALGVQASVWG